MAQLMADPSQQSRILSIRDFAYAEDEELHFAYIDTDNYDFLDDDDDEEEEEEEDDGDYDYDDGEEEEDDDGMEIDESGNRVPGNTASTSTSTSTSSKRRKRRPTRRSIISLSGLPQGFTDGPPWQEDPDLRTPVIEKEQDEYKISITSNDEIHGKAIALFDFEPENDNEVRLREGQIIWISYRHGQGWLVAEDSETRETGLVPEEYVQLLSEGSYYEEEPRQMLPHLMSDDNNNNNTIQHNDNSASNNNNKAVEGEEGNESDWIDEDEDELPKVETLKIK